MGEHKNKDKVHIHEVLKDFPRMPTFEEAQNVRVTFHEHVMGNAYRFSKPQLRAEK